MSDYIWFFVGFLIGLLVWTVKCVLQPFLEPCIRCEHVYQDRCSPSKYINCKMKGWAYFKRKLK